ncbi:streptococcal hemagglutinin [Bactrocera oleae]|uniref:streptococcal hemagglutinin n=1 Tax=Bactrocera oleae TaxID=104688 RepID=UPI00387EC983
MSDSESLKSNATTNLAVAVSSVITMDSQAATNSKQTADSTTEYVSTKNDQLSVMSTTNDDERAINSVSESQAQKPNTVKELSQTHDSTSLMDSTVSNQSQNSNSSKRVIRKIMVIDPKKLQQAGLDRKLAEAIGRHKLKVLAKEQKKRVQDWDSHKLQRNEASEPANKPMQTEVSSLTATSAQAAVPATVTTTCTATSTSTPNTTNATPQIFSPIKPLESFKNCLLVPSASEKLVTQKINVTPINKTITATTASKSPNVERKVFVTPKITITRPGEEPHTVRIVPEHRLENVKYILQCKILKRQQLAAVQAPQSPQSPQIASISPSQHTPTTTEMSWIEPKVEMEEFINIPKDQQPKKPSPAKTRQDVARVLDFSADTATASATTVSTPNANEHKVEKVITNSSVHIRNYTLNARKESPTKEETVGTRAVDVARLVARINNVTMRKNPVQTPDKPLNTMEIPKATIRCKKLPVQNNHKNVSNRDNANITKQLQEPREKAKALPLVIDKNIGPTNEEKIVKTVNKDPLEQPTQALNDKATTDDALDNQNSDQSQFNNFPLFSPLKKPFPVVTHSQDLPLPKISTFKTPFPTTLIKVGQMGPAQGDTTEPTSDNFLKNTYFVTPAVSIPVTQTPKSLIVLENKVLSQDEKIDLTALGFGTPKIKSTTGVTMEANETKATTRIAQKAAQISQTQIVSITPSPVKNVLPQKGAKLNNRTIVSMDKLKLSSDKIAELVKAIQLKNANSSKHFLVVRKAENVVKPSENVRVLSKSNINDASSSQTCPTVTQPAENSASVDLPVLCNNTISIEKPTVTPKTPIPNIPVSQLSEIYKSNAQQVLSTPTDKDFVTTTAAVSAPTIYQAPKNVVVSQFKNPLPPNPQKLIGSNQNPHNKSAVCVLDSGDESDSPISAVDFIASLAAENPITEDMKLELSPEELNLNASFAMNFSPLRIPYRDRTESLKGELIEQDVFEDCNVPNAETLSELFEPEMASDDVQIGKIITISEENILNAVAASTKLDINNEQTNIGTQEVFKLTKSTERLDTMQEESQVNNLENVNNLDIVQTDSLTESTVGPIIVKNLEIEAIDNSADIGEINKTLGAEVPDTSQIQILPTEGEALVQNSTTVEEGAIDADKTDLCKISEEPATANTAETSQTTAAIPDVINVGDKNTETVEVNANVSLIKVDKVLSPQKPNALTASEEELKETTNTEIVAKNTKNETESPVMTAESSILTGEPTSHLNNDKIVVSGENVTPAGGENSKAVPRRLPRFKKGKINLVQRKKTTSSASVKKQETKSLSENSNEATSDQDLNEKKTTIEETAVTSKLCRQTDEGVEKTNEDKKLNEQEAAIAQIAATSNFAREGKRKSETLSHNLTAKVEVNKSVITEHVLVTECTNGLSTPESERATNEVVVSEIAVPHTTTANESPLKSDELKRKTEIITNSSVIRHSPKILKRKSVGSDTKSHILCDVPIEQASSTTNLLLSVVKAPTAETKLTPAKNPFKKTKIEADADQQTKKGIQNLLTKFNKEPNSSEAEKLSSDNTIVKQREIVEAGGNLEKNHTQAKLQKSCAQKTDQLSNTSEKKPQPNTANFEVSTNSAITEAEELQETSKTCDILHVITEEKLMEQNFDEKVAKANTPSTEDAEKPGKIKIDFLGFNHNSPSTHNIESNLKQILTITTSAEKTKTREVDHSTAERESPHVALSDSSVKSSMTTGKTTTRKSNIVSRRKPTNRRSVPLKKRWGVLHESDDDINITDDTSPADDDEEEDDEPSSQAPSQSKESDKNMNKIKTHTSDSEKGKTMDREEEKESSIKGGIVLPTDVTDTRISDSKKRNRFSEDSIDTVAHATDADTVAEKTNPKALQAPSKKVRFDAKLENISASNSTQSIAELTVKPPANVSKSASTLEDTAVNEVTNDKNEGGTSENIVERKAVDSEESCALERRSKTLDVKEPVINEAGNVAVQPKSGKKRGRKPKINAVTATTLSVLTESEPAESMDKTVDCSMNECVKTEINESRKLAVEKVKDADLSTFAPQEFATSTPLAQTAPEVGNTKRGRKRKLPVETVAEDKNETVNDEESTPVVRKKRGRKPKSALLNETEVMIYNDVSEAEKAVDITQESCQQDLNATLLNSSINITEIMNASQAKTEFETPIKIPKKRGRKPKALLATPDSSAQCASPKPNEKQQGRRAKVIDLETRGNFNERLLLITNRSQLDTDEVLTALTVTKTAKKTLIQCGLCLQQMQRDTWVKHLATHYGVGWIVGEMTPINVTIRNEVLKVMTAFLKANVGKYPLTCRMCQRTYRSALGTLLHIEICGATDTRTPCDYCKKEYSKFSVVSHMRSCSKRLGDEELNETATEAKAGADENKEAVLNNVGRLKRASVQKAEKMLKALKDSQSTGIFCTKDAKNHVEFVEAEKIMETVAKNLETTGSAECPAQGCKFTAKDLGAIKEHFASCDLKETVSKGVYICKLCAKTTKFYRCTKYVIKHILQQHKSIEVDQDFEGDNSDCGIKTDDESSGEDDDVSSGVDSDEENNANNNESDSSSGEAAVRKKKTVKKKTTTAWSNSISADRLHPPREPDYSGTARLLWKEFVTQNYSTAPLFSDVNVKYTICARSEYENYIPATATSMKFNYNSDLKLCKSAPHTSFGKGENDLKWSQLQRLETTSVKNEQFTFLGEAIKTVTWLPLPTDIKEQYLLISTRRAYTRFKGPKIGNTLLWLYKVTSADTSKSCDLQLQYAINITDAPVHCLAFLPSGGYDAHANRLGLLAVGTAKNTIKVYALPLCVENERLSEETAETHLENFTTLQLEPVWLLAIDLSKKDLSQHPFVDTQCTALCWSEFAEHMHIFAGFANGCVAYWDVSSVSNINRFIIDGLPHYVPLNFFYTREKNVRAMALHYDSSGVRVIAVIVARRLLILYDLYHFSRPFILKEEITKNEGTDLEWSPIWQSLAISMGDSLPNNGRCVFAVNPSNIVFKNETIDKMNAGVNKIHYNPLQNVLVNATDNGDVVLLDLREMHLKEILRDSMRSSQAVGIMDMKCLNGTDIPKFDAKSTTADWSFIEENCNEKYGLVFGPVTRIDKSLKAQYLSEQRRVPVNLTTCTRINTIQCNINNHGKHLVAAGYENGFLRIFHMDRKSFFY